jgi:hypothetical protein
MARRREHADLEAFLRRAIPDHRILAVRPLRPDDTDTGAHAATAKGAGYGEPLRITLAHERTGAERDVVLHFAASNPFGHDRRADRADETLLAYDTFDRIPHHARAIDVGVVGGDGRLHSLRGAGEFWLLTEWAAGHVYADELRRIASTNLATATDVARAEALARCLVELHTPIGADPVAYTRAIRDLVGHGEGIFGIVDGYPPDVPAAPIDRLEAIERACVAWRWRLKDRAHRLRRTHGDFHPFNVVFDDQGALTQGTLTLLDASRGGRGDPADDATCMSANYVFFAVTAPSPRAAWQNGFARLWHRFWDTYLEGTKDAELAEVAAPFFTWRLLVVANPRWYPALAPEARDKLLGFAERLLALPRFFPEIAEELFR